MKNVIFPIILFLLLPLSAHAYVPAGDDIIQKWSAAYDRTSQVTIVGRYTQGDGEVHFQVEGSRSRVDILENGTPTQDATSMLVWGILLRPSTLLEQWKRGGHLDPERTGLAREGDRFAWTLGVRGEQREGTQIWIDRQRKTPFLVVPPESLYTARRITFQGYDQSGNRAFPTRITVTGKDGMERTYHIDSISAASNR